MRGRRSKRPDVADSDERASAPAAVDHDGASALASPTATLRRRLRPEDDRVIYKQIPIAEQEYLRLRGEVAKVLAGILARMNHEAVDQRDAGPRGSLDGGLA